MFRRARRAATAAGVAALLLPASAGAELRISGKLVDGYTSEDPGLMALVLRNVGTEAIGTIRIRLVAGLHHHQVQSGPVQMDCPEVTGGSDTIACAMRGPWAPPTELAVRVGTRERYPDGGGAEVWVCASPCQGQEVGPFAIPGPGPVVEPPPPVCEPPRYREGPFDRYARARALWRFWLRERDVARRQWSLSRRRPLLRRKLYTYRLRAERAERKARRALRALASRAVPARVSEALGYSQEDVDDCVDGMIAHMEESLRASGYGIETGQGKELIESLRMLRLLLNPVGEEHVSDEEKDEILKDAVLGLVKTVAGKRENELSGKTYELYAVLTGQIGKDRHAEVFRSNVRAIAAKIDKKNGDELAAVAFDLIDVLAGDLTPEKRDEMLQRHIIGLATRVVGEGIIKGPHVRAFLTGFDLMRPFAAQIAQNLTGVANVALHRACTLALEEERSRRDEQSIEGVSVKITSESLGAPSSLVGWTCAAFQDPAHGLVFQATSPYGATTYILDAEFGFILGTSELTFFEWLVSPPR